MTNNQTPIQDLVDHTLRSLKWLSEDGYQERRQSIGHHQFVLWIDGPHASIIVSADMARGGEIDVWLTPAGAPEKRRLLRDYLAARGLPAVAHGYVARSYDSAMALIDDIAAALKLLRNTELAGDWATPEPINTEAVAERHRQILEQIREETRRLEGEAT